MTIEKWESVRHNLHAHMEIFYEYFIERGGKVQDEQTFYNAFIQATKQEIIVTNTQGRPVRISEQTIINSVLDYYNTMYGIT